MKHGDKAKSKTASKASNKKSGKTSASSKSAKITHSKKQAVAAKSPQKSSPEKPSAARGNGKVRPGPVDFTNPVVGAAFKRALKKYSNAFRRLTD